ncbi:hypothetical protein LP419_12470 [Massilia sp. H-1]|nr:hypothetical protein LP419_12470 [Massilia sp. H-1]
MLITFCRCAAALVGGRGQGRRVRPAVRAEDLDEVQFQFRVGIDANHAGAAVVDGGDGA